MTEWLHFLYTQHSAWSREGIDKTRSSQPTRHKHAWRRYFSWVGPFISRQNCKPLAGWYPEWGSSNHGFPDSELELVPPRGLEASVLPQLCAVAPTWPVVSCCLGISPTTSQTAAETCQGQSTPEVTANRSPGVLLFHSFNKHLFWASWKQWWVKWHDSYPRGGWTLGWRQAGPEFGGIR